MTDIRTNYLGIPIKSPLVAGASPLSSKTGSLRKMEDAGIGAVVLQSLFEEQIEHESLALNYYLNQGTETVAEALSYFPEMEKFNVGPDKYLENIQKAKQTVDLPIIASLNGFSSGGWLRYAKKIEEAGADALELNIYFLPTELDFPAEDIEQSYVDLVRDVREIINIPLAVKLSPYFTSIPSLSHKLTQAGADGLVLFNRFYQPEVNIEELEVGRNLDLSNSSEIGVPLRWIAILHNRLEVDLIHSSGVHTSQDLIKSILVGANAAQSVSALIRNGEGHAKTMLDSLREWMQKHGYENLKQMQGVLSQKKIAEPAAFERANYLKLLDFFKQNYLQ